MMHQPALHRPYSEFTVDGLKAAETLDCTQTHKDIHHTLHLLSESALARFGAPPEARGIVPYGLGLSPSPLLLYPSLNGPQSPEWERLAFQIRLSPPLDTLSATFTIPSHLNLTQSLHDLSKVKEQVQGLIPLTREFAAIYRELVPTLRAHAADEMLPQEVRTQYASCARQIRIATEVCPSLSRVTQEELELLRSLAPAAQHATEEAVLASLGLTRRTDVGSDSAEPQFPSNGEATLFDRSSRYFDELLEAPRADWPKATVKLLEGLRKLRAGYELDRACYGDSQILRDELLTKQRTTFARCLAQQVASWRSQ